MLDDRELEKAFLICITFVLIFTSLPTNLLGEGFDYDFHFDKAENFNTPQQLSKNKQGEKKVYPYLFHFFAQFFTYRQETFKFFGILFLGLIIPMTLFYLKQNWLTVFFYFTTTSFFYFFEQGIYPQAMTLLLMLLILVLKKPFYRLLITFLALLAHSWGIQLILLTLASVYFYESGLAEKTIKTLNKLKKKILLGCSGWFPITKNPVTGKITNTRPDKILDMHLLSKQINQWAMSLRISFLLKLLVEIFPLPFLIMGLKQTIENKHYQYLSLAIASLILGSFMDYRIFFILPLVLIPGLVDFYTNIQKYKYKALFMLLTITYGIIQFIVWYRYKAICFPYMGLV